MNASGDSVVEQAGLIRELNDKRARAELEAADRLCPGADAVLWRGALGAPVMLLKGEPNEEERAEKAALAGEVGDAALAALAALGWRDDEIFRALSRPEPGLDPARCADRLRLMIEAIDPRVIVVLDARAAEDAGRALGVAMRAAGGPVTAGGRTIVVLDDFEASLADPRRKRAAWRRLQAAARPGPVY